MRSFLFTCLFFAAAAVSLSGGPNNQVCRIDVVDAGSGWPVPLVILETTHGMRFVSDNAGVVAVDTPELLGREVWFHVRSPGYEVKQDRFGQRGIRLKLLPGTAHQLKVTRTSIARRVGRLTGAGLFAERQKAGQKADMPPEPQPFGSVEWNIVGCDSVQTALHNGRRIWIWGDTTLARYPLGIFHSSCAMTEVNGGFGWADGQQAFTPPLRPRFDYVRDRTGKPAGVAKMPGDGPTWLDGLVSVADAQGRARLVAHYVKVKGFVDVAESGLCVWDDVFHFEPEPTLLWSKDKDGGSMPAAPGGHAVKWTDADDKQWLLFGNPLPTLRCPATFEAWRDPARWQTLKPQATIPRVGGGAAVQPQSGSIAWHPGRKIWVCIFTEKFGKPSFIGEVWFAQATSPTGPWGSAVKILSHENYSFYNPKVHTDLLPADSKELLFEGTYTTLFVDKPVKTPRYDYNQLLYRLDLNDPRLRSATESRK